MEHRTLVFCTTYAESPHEWATRYWRWLRYVRSCGLRYDRLILVDDASPVLPGWPNMPVYATEVVPKTPERHSIHRFQKRLGQNRGGPEPFPGWYRSFGYALRYAVREGLERVVHVESDAYLLSKRAIEFFNNCNEGWVALWCNAHGWPETTLQIINTDQLSAAVAFFSRSYSEHREVAIEKVLPLTGVNRDLVGDRYGELGLSVPYNADYVSQVRWDQGDSYFWWIQTTDAPLPAVENDPAQWTGALEEAYAVLAGRRTHDGIDYRDFLSFLSQNLLPRGYLEIGTEEGESLSRFNCDSLCIDPHFRFPGEVVGRKRRLSLFQMTSDEFFAEFDPKRYIETLDICFLDGLHQYEVLLRDFLNFERHAHSRSLATLHDCFPLNARMTSRVHGPGPDDEPEATRNFWTGDVWKVIPILRALRPDLRIVGVDCPPTGLLLVSGLDPQSQTLLQEYASAVREWAAPDFASYGFRTLWDSVLVLDSRRVIADPRLFCQLYKLQT